MITPDGWLDWAERIPGPPDKVYGTPNAIAGYVAHSAVGYLPGWKGRLLSKARQPNGRYTPQAAASVHLWVSYDGHVIQHYPFTASCWAQGGRYQNTHFIAAETEGGAAPKVSEPLTDKQVASHIRIIRELSEWREWTPKRPASPNDKGATLYEHDECARLWGGDRTECPSKRIPWQRILDGMNETTDESPQEDEMPLKVIKGSKAYTYATNGVHKWLIPDQDVLRQLRDAGILDSKLQELSDAAVNAIPTIQ